MLSIGLAALSFLAVTLKLPRPIHPCYDTNLVKFLNPPNVDGGLDVKDSRQNIVLADDFLCTNAGPITDIYLWGSWLSNNIGTVTNFWIGIYNDIPATAANPTVIPARTCSGRRHSPLDNTEKLRGQREKRVFLIPPITPILGPDNQAWFYCFHAINPFVQQGTTASPTNYWLAVRALLPPDGTLYGWKTSLVPYNDAAVWGTVGATGLPEWRLAAHDQPA